jgi:hypothetical protein
MGFLERIRKAILPPRPTSRYYPIKVKCTRCREVLEGRVDLYNEPSQEYEGEMVFYICRKVLMGSASCHQQVETTFKFDEARNMLERLVVGGEFVE